MKKLLSNPATLLKYVVTFSIAFILLASVVTVFFGFNKSVYFGDSYEVRIKLVNGEEDYNNVLEKTENILNASNYQIREHKLETSTYDYSLLVRFNSDKELKSIASLTTKLATAIGVKESNISIDYIKTTNSIHYWVNLLIILIVSLVAVFIYGLFRKNIVLACSYTLQYLFSLLIGLSIFTVARIEVSLTTINILLVFSIISILMSSYIINRVEQVKHKNENENKKLSQLIGEIMNDNKFIVIIMSISFLAVFIGLLFTQDLNIIYASLAGIVGLVVALFSVCFFGCPLYLSIIEHSENKIKEVMSRNNLEENNKKISAMQNSKLKDKN